MMWLLGLLTVVIWLVLWLGHGRFWQTTISPLPGLPKDWPSVVAVIPARNEAEGIGRTVGSLLGQDYKGRVSVVVVDDESTDGTAEVANRTAASMNASDRLLVVLGTPTPPGWVGKMWAVAQGLEAAGKLDPSARYVLLTDGDIGHSDRNVAHLVARAEAGALDLTSLMVRLRCVSIAEKAMIPAFVFFFQMLYPFARVNRPAAKMAAAAGGCMLVKRQALADAGGVAVIADAIIDDCAMGATMKRQGPIRLSLTRRSASIRPYGGWREVGMMIARSAYAQLGYSPLMLLGTLLGMGIVYLAPPLLALFGHGGARVAGALAWLAMAICLQPMLRFYRRSPLWGLALPLIGMF
jgi:hopene-associated glycosyltransferase HpnB